MLTNLKPSTMHRMRRCNEDSHENQDVKLIDGVHMNAVEEINQSRKVERLTLLVPYDHAD